MQYSALPGLATAAITLALHQTKKKKKKTRSIVDKLTVTQLRNAPPFTDPKHTHVIYRCPQLILTLSHINQIHKLPMSTWPILKQGCSCLHPGSQSIMGHLSFPVKLLNVFLFSNRVTFLATLTLFAFIIRIFGKNFARNYKATTPCSFFHPSFKVLHLSPLTRSQASIFLSLMPNTKFQYPTQK